VRLRAGWRLAIGGPAGAREGLALLDPMLARFSTRADLALRAELAAAAGDLGGALATWMELAGRSSAAEREALARRVIERLQAAEPAVLAAGERAVWLAEWQAQLDPH
jgi:hypothetical protein